MHPSIPLFKIREIMEEQSSKIAIKYYTLANLLDDNELTY